MTAHLTKGWLTAIRNWRPSLRGAVAVACLAVVSVTALLTATLAADQLRQVAVHEALRNAQSVVASYLDPELHRQTMAPGGTRDETINAQLERLVADGHMLRVILWSPSGEVAYASDPMLRGHTEEVDEDLLETLEGASKVEYGDAALLASEMEQLPVLKAPFLELYIPIRGADGGEAIGIYEAYQDAAPIEARVAETWTWVLIVAFAAAAILFAILWLGFSGASRLLATQNRLLRERSIRDPLTGLHNHGHLLSELARHMQRIGRGAGSGGSLAIVDVDSFRLLNAAYGHDAGDYVLRRVATVLAAVVHPEQLVGRSGPDEFMLLDFGEGADPAGNRLLTTIDAARAAFREIDLQFGASERLPLTVSVGVARAPGDGTKPLDLLSVAEAALREAKTGGGSTTRVADQATIRSLAAQNTVFGVMEGLVATIDAKDHYTRHHSEDVTGHALFLAGELGLPDDDLRRLRLAGLLHDVGKVGIPDSILRKPGPLTDPERETVKQHVALGDAIVGAVPHLADVRASVRHHHERWDGAGYLDGLRGEQIPLLARILAVADAYSAMTTDRPYRKALSPDEALARVAQGAGTQLDPNLAISFVRAMRRRPAAERSPARLPRPAAPAVARADAKR
jgi:diguanylate cyclase (GGDEF)-like protein